MALVFKGGGFVHIPKTGGRWVLANLERANINFQRLGDYHNNPQIDGKVFICVRRPDQWIKSYFYQQRKKGWELQPSRWEVDKCKSQSIDGFVENILSNPGIIGRFFENWMNNDVFIGKTESLPESLIAYMRMMNFAYNEKEILRNKNNYKSPADDFPKSYIQDLKRTEYDFINKFYPKWI